MEEQGGVDSDSPDATDGSWMSVLIQLYELPPWSKFFLGEAACWAVLDLRAGSPCFADRRLDIHLRGPSSMAAVCFIF